MRIPSLPLTAMARDWPARPPKAAGAEASAPPAPSPADGASPAAGGPPGLQKVLERLQAMPEGERTRGQTQAMTRIERNLQRYLEHQGLAAPAPAPAPSPDAVTPPEPVAGETPATPPDGDAGAVTGATTLPVATEEPVTIEDAVAPAPADPADDTSEPLTTAAVATELPDPIGELLDSLTGADSPTQNAG